VQAAITAASKTLPQTMTAPPTYKKLNPADAPILILSAQSDSLPITVVDEYADSFLAQQISQVPGVARFRLAVSSGRRSASRSIPQSSPRAA
jgi:HAE1 family hydrophobic/amphiphilic exporter-1